MNVRGEKPSRQQGSEVSKSAISSWTFFEVTSQLRVGHWTMGKKGEGQQISSKNCYLRIKCLPTNPLTALMWR